MTHIHAGCLKDLPVNFLAWDLEGCASNDVETAVAFDYQERSMPER